MKQLIRDWKAKRELKRAATKYLTSQFNHRIKTCNSELSQVAAELLKKN